LVAGKVLNWVEEKDKLTVLHLVEKKVELKVE